MSDCNNTCDPKLSFRKDVHDKIVHQYHVFQCDFNVKIKTGWSFGLHVSPELIQVHSKHLELMNGNILIVLFGSVPWEPEVFLEQLWCF